MENRTTIAEQQIVSPNGGSGNLRAALGHAQRGLHIIPCCWPVDGGCGCRRGHEGRAIGKAPLTEHGWADATVDVATITAWWERWPQANIGMALEPSGRMVLDLDSVEAKEEALRRGLPPSPVVRTGRGEQRHFKHPGPGYTNRTRVGDSGKVDLLVNGIVIIPPSVHANGRKYMVELSEELPEPMPWMMDLLKKKVEPEPVELGELPVMDPAALHNALASLPKRIGALILTGETDGYKSRSEAGWGAICALLQAGLTNEEIAAVIWGNPIGEYARERGKGWLAGELARARATVELQDSERGAVQPHDPLEALFKLNGQGDPQALDQALRALGAHLAGADALTRETMAAAAIKALEEHGVRRAARLVDAAIRNTEERKLQGQAAQFAELVPARGCVDGGKLLDALTGEVRRYIIIDPDYAQMVALWTLHTYVFQQFDVTPRLPITSPDKRCGKTRLLDLLERLVHRPIRTDSPTAAVLFRIIEQYRPTVLLDEADSYLNDDRELQQMLNSGHHRNGYATRCEGDNNEVRWFSVWAPVALAGIGKFYGRKGTLADRSIEARLQRKTKQERVARLRMRKLGRLDGYRRMALKWVLDNVPILSEADPGDLNELHDRANDNWRGLLAIADVAGGHWPSTARSLAKKLESGREADEEDSIHVRILVDIKDLFDARKVEGIKPGDLVDALVSMEARPWSEWRRGRPMGTQALANQLGTRTFGIKARQGRQSQTGKSEHCYWRTDFEEAWKRYLSPGGGVLRFKRSNNPDRASDTEDSKFKHGGGLFEPGNGGSPEQDGVVGTFEPGAPGPEEETPIDVPEGALCGQCIHWINFQCQRKDKARDLDAPACEHWRPPPGGATPGGAA